MRRRSQKKKECLCVLARAPVLAQPSPRPGRGAQACRPRSSGTRVAVRVARRAVLPTPLPPLGTESRRRPSARCPTQGGRARRAPASHFLSSRELGQQCPANAPPSLTPQIREAVGVGRACPHQRRAPRRALSLSPLHSRSHRTSYATRYLTQCFLHASSRAGLGHVSSSDMARGKGRRGRARAREVPQRKKRARVCEGGGAASVFSLSRFSTCYCNAPGGRPPAHATHTLSLSLSLAHPPSLSPDSAHKEKKK